MRNATNVMTQQLEAHLGESSEPSDDHIEKFVLCCFWILVAYTFLRNLLTAVSKPLWFDEIITLSVARQPKWSDIWQALSHSKDAQPPAYYMLERIFASLSTNQEIAYRLPSILGFCCVLVCIFVVIRRRESSLVALICASSLLLTPLLRPYAVEARPYSVVAASVAFALVCYQHAPKRRWLILMGAAFIAGESWHYYALFGFLPFGVAELAVLVRTRRIRWGVWLALAVSFLPLFTFWHLLMGMRQFYGSHVWDPPSLFATANAYALLFRTFAPIAFGVVAVLMVLTWWAGTDDLSERWTAITFLLLPVIVFLATELTHGAYQERYVLPTLFGIPLSLAYALRITGRKGVALVAVFIFIAVGLQEAFFWQGAIHERGRLLSPAQPIEQLVNRAGYPGLPVAISDGHDYLQFVHYAQDAKRFVSIVDPPQAIVYAGSDSVDLELPVLQCCLPLQVYEFHEFVGQHPRFLLYSGGAEWDWWPARLVNDGYLMQMLVSDKTRKVYLVSAP